VDEGEGVEAPETLTCRVEGVTTRAIIISYERRGEGRDGFEGYRRSGAGQGVGTEGGRTARPGSKEAAGEGEFRRRRRLLEMSSRRRDWLWTDSGGKDERTGQG
jgi:hypothetical protein